MAPPSSIFYHREQLIVVYDLVSLMYFLDRRDK